MKDGISIISKAHQWVQKLPLSANILVCERCGIETRIGEWNIQRCQPHYEFLTSGWLPE